MFLFSNCLHNSSIGLPTERVIIAGGQDPSLSFTSTAFLYHVSTDTWTPEQSLPGTRWNFIPRKGSLLALSGIDGGNAYVYDTSGVLGWIQVPQLEGMGKNMGDTFAGIYLEDDTPFDCVD